MIVCTFSYFLNWDANHQLYITEEKDKFYLSHLLCFIFLVEFAYRARKSFRDTHPWVEVFGVCSVAGVPLSSSSDLCISVVRSHALLTFSFIYLHNIPKMFVFSQHCALWFASKVCEMKLTRSFHCRSHPQVSTTY